MAQDEEVRDHRMTPAFDEAFRLAHEVHGRALRKGTAIPYVAHVLGVTAITLEYGGTEAEAIGALLHDTVEDGGGEARLAEIRARFGDEVGDIVLGCSDSLSEDPEQKAPWRERKENYVRQLEQASASVCLVSAADKLHNVRAISRDFHEVGDAVWTRFTGGKEGTLWYYDAVSITLLRRWPSALAQDLRREVDELLEIAQ
jgi:(p)ppGpp synthase/HD superfamily hydrolase